MSIRDRNGRLAIRAAVMSVAAVALPLITLPGAATAAENGSISGKVTDSSGNPVGPGSGMCILVGNSSGWFSNLNPDGTYRIDDIAPGSYAVRFVQCGTRQAPWPAYAPEFYPNLHDPALAESPQLPNVTVRSAATTANVDASVEIGGSLAVTVKDSSGTPRPGLCVEANPRGYLDLRGVVGGLPTRFPSVSDANGKVLLEGMPPATYYLQAQPCDPSILSDPDLGRLQFSGGSFDVDHATTTSVQLGQRANAADLVMAPGATISGRVTADGEPIANSCVSWGRRNEANRRQVLTDAEGRYTIRGITPTLAGTVQACPGGQNPTAWWSGSDYAPLWFGGAASRWTATEFGPAPGSTTVWNPQLQPTGTLSAIITSLPSATGCQVVVADATPGDTVAAPRPTLQAGVWVADAFGLTSPTGQITLSCNGRTVGKATVAVLGIPFYEPGWTENTYAPTVEIPADVAGPAIAAVGIPATWTTKPVTVSFKCTDGRAGVATCPAAQSFAEGTRRTVSATDKYGNASSLTVGPLKIDQTPPALTVATTQSTFRRDETLNLGCRIADTRSGLKSQSNTCPPNGTPAAQLGVGDHQFHLLAADNAGNQAGTLINITIVK